MKKLIKTAALLAVPLAAIFGALLFDGARWDVAAVLMALLCCVMFFLSFEKRRPLAREVVLISVMTAFSVAGRVIFAVIPFFKPVSAVVIVTALHFGPYAGFMCGAMSALISNIYFGQGAWTPFQMLCWGVIGFLAGALNRKGALEKSVPLCVFGVAAGALYSIVMEVWTVLSAEGAFSTARFFAAAASGLPVTAMYCASNALFLLVLKKPLGSKLKRLKTKYGVFCTQDDV